MEKLDIDETLAGNKASSHITDPVFNASKKYEYHLSIKKYFEANNKILAKIHNLNNKK